MRTRSAIAKSIKENVMVQESDQHEVLRLNSSINGSCNSKGEASVSSESPRTTTDNSEHNTHYPLDPEEFGPLTDREYLYSPKFSQQLEVENDDLATYYTFVTTYFCYLFLSIVGHSRDFIEKLFDLPESRSLHEKDGYAPLFDGFDSFYSRRMKHRLDDCFNRITTGVPGRLIEVLDRYSEDENNNYTYTGTTSKCLNLASYNYLGFAQSVGQCTDAAEEAIRHYGLTSIDSRATCGTLPLHCETERIVAQFVGKEASILCSMGYSTNANIFSALVDRNCLVISDELNHASIRVGLRSSGCVIRIFKHNDMNYLEQLLREHISQGQPRTHRPWKKILVVVEGLYSMEGTLANLPKLVELRQKYKFYLFVDEAHSIGALGANGRGVCDYFSIDPSNVDILMGTFTKSFGASGGYIAGDKYLIDAVRTKNLANIYAESTPPAVLAQIISSLKTINGEIRPGEGQERLQRIAFNSRYLRLGLKKLGFIVSGQEDSPVVPLMLYHPAKMPLVSRYFLKNNIAVALVGYPACALASCRVRFCVSSALTKDDLDKVLRVSDEIGGFARLKMSQYRSKATGERMRGDVEEVIKTLAEDCKLPVWVD